MKAVRKVFMEGYKGLVQNGDPYTLYSYVTTIKYLNYFYPFF
jgi:hypothetical protein